jgi:hypothetical protein
MHCVEELAEINGIHIIQALLPPLPATQLFLLSTPKAEEIHRTNEGKKYSNTSR